MPRDTFDEEMTAIIRRYVWGSRYRDLNDPMEGLYEAALHNGETEQYADGVRAVFDMKSNVGIASLSEAPDLDLMWAHYGDGAKGICIAYDLEALVYGLPDGTEIVRVMYGERPSSIQLRGGNDYQALAKSVLSTKSSRWLYEREWRLLLPRPGRNTYTDVGVVTHVYLGPRIDPLVGRRIEERLDGIVPVSRVEVDGYRLVSELGHW